MADYNKVGLLVLRGDRLLLCRKRTLTSKLILPGGCLEAGETVDQALRREIREELGEVKLGPAHYLGTYLDRAASDDPTVEKTVEIRLYQGEIEGEPRPCSEIVQLIWFGPDSDRSELSPILVNHILPDLFERAILPWGEL